MKGKNLVVLRVGSAKGKNPVMGGPVSRDSSSSEFDWAPRMTLLNTLRRLYVDSHEEAKSSTNRNSGVFPLWL